MKLTLEQFKTITQSGSRAAIWFSHMSEAMEKFGINTPHQIAMFLSNVAVESGSLKWAKEIWGPSKAQSGYEGRKDLGNVKPGDGKRYMGRGPIQITGRANYAAATKRLSAHYDDTPNFENNPEQLETPSWGSRAAAEFWFRNNINKYADIKDFDGACDAVNRGRKTSDYGDANGFKERLHFYTIACNTLGINQ